MSVMMIYVTCADAAEAEKVAAHLLEQKLIACANIMAPHTSLYEWQGKAEKGTETAMFLKTTDDMFETVQQEISTLHSYECPCIVGIPVIAGHAPFLQWISDQVATEV